MTDGFYTNSPEALGETAPFPGQARKEPRPHLHLADSGRISLNGKHIGRVIKLNDSTYGVHDAKGRAVVPGGPWTDPWDAAEAMCEHYLKDHPVPAMPAPKVSIRLGLEEIRLILGLLPADQEDLRVRFQVAEGNALIRNANDEARAKHG